MRRILVVAIALQAGVASANPVSLDVARAKQVPGTLHVQITYAVDGASANKPTKLTRDGTELGGSWTAFSGYSANTGSGLRTCAAQQLCDCNVSAGSHKYELTASAGGTEHTLSVSVTVVSSLEEPKDAGAPAGDFMPWEIPEPNPIQGLDCKTACAAPRPDQGATPRDGGVVADAKANPPAAKDEGGCSLASGRASVAGLALLLALALLGAALRRRR